MGVRGMFYFRFLSLLVWFLFLATPSTVKAQGGCFLQTINLEPCRDEVPNSISESCCRALNQALEVGFYCFCLLLSASKSSIPLNFPFAFPLSNCYISVPPLANCQAPIPGFYIPASPVTLPPSPELRQPSFSPKVPLSLNSTLENNSTATIGQSHPTSEETPKLSLSSTGNVTSQCDDEIKKWSNRKAFVLLLIFSACTLWSTV